MVNELQAQRRIVMVGKAGVGKSQSGNGILGRNVFESKTSFKSVTKIVNHAMAKRFGHHTLVYDTPGGFDPEQRDDFSPKVLDCLLKTIPGIHCITIVISCKNKLTREDEKMLKFLKDKLGNDYINYVIVVFTHTDVDTLESLLQEGSSEETQFFDDFMDSIKRRYVCFGNTEDSVDIKYVLKYFRVLENMIIDNSLKRREPFFKHHLYDLINERLQVEAITIQRQRGLSEEESMMKAIEKARNGEIKLTYIRLRIYFCRC